MTPEANLRGGAHALVLPGGDREANVHFAAVASTALEEGPVARTVSAARSRRADVVDGSLPKPHHLDGAEHPHRVGQAECQRGGVPAVGVERGDVAVLRAGRGAGRATGEAYRAVGDLPG